MLKLSEHSEALKWLSQFHPSDQSDASCLLDAITLVSRDEFTDGLSDLVRGISQTIDGPVGLYIEREVRKRKGIPNRLFKESRTKHKRADGNGPKIIQPLRGYAQEVGSEGLVSQLCTELQRADGKKYFVNPGPTQIRKHKIRAFVLVTDFIGSGNRATDYLDAAWKIASVKSWKSLKYITFHVASYSGTPSGIRKVQAHKSNLVVHEVLSCPTIDTAFDSDVADNIKSLCKRFSPVGWADEDALGFDGTGGLIAFAHGAPNNLPQILHKKGVKWHPLFPGRSTSKVRSIFGEEPDEHSIAVRLNKLKENGIANSGWLSRKSKDGRSLILLMVALRNAPRFDDVLSRKTGLTIPEIRSFVGQLENWGWIDHTRRLTEEGYKQLRHARKKKASPKALPNGQTEHYYPKSLRMPQ